MRYLYIVNPTAGGGRAVAMRQLIKKFYESGDPAISDPELEYQIVETEAPGHATNLACAAASRFDLVIAVGGDGTINEVCKGLLAAGCGMLGVVPAGTGNDLASGLGLPSNPWKALRHLHQGKARAIDYGRVNGQVFVNSASLGFDADVANHANHIKRRVRSHTAYTVGLIQSIFGYRNIPVVLDTDRRRNVRGRALLLAVGNGRFYGGGFEIVPDAVMDDGQFDVCLIANISKPMLAALLPTILLRMHTKVRRYVQTWKTRRVSVTVLGDCLLNIDGEIRSLSRGTTVDFEIVPGGLQLLG